MPGNKILAASNPGNNSQIINRPISKKRQMAAKIEDAMYDYYIDAPAAYWKILNRLKYVETDALFSAMLWPHE
jgi:hypothetical protein